MYKIGIVIHDFKLGGSERIALRLANYWAKLGQDVVIFCGAHTGEMLSLLDAQVRVISAAPSIERQSGSLATLARAARKFFSENKVNFCYIPGNYHWPVTHALSRMPSHVRPVLVTQISSLIYKNGRSRISQFLFNCRMHIFLKKSDLIVVLDEETAKQSNSILRRTDTKVIPLPALPEEVFIPTAPPHNYSVLAAGRLTEQKGFDTLIRAFRLVVDAVPEAQLKICGEGELRAELQNLICVLNLSQNVTLLGFQNNIIPFLEESSIFVLSSRREGYGAVLLEALAAGRFVVTTRCTPAVTDIFEKNPQYGVVVAVDDIRELSKEIVGNILKVPDISSKIQEITKPYRINYGAKRYLDLVTDYIKNGQTKEI